MTSSDWIAVIALIIASGALALELKRWFESGPKLHIRVMPEAIMTGEPKGTDKSYVVVLVTNRGSIPTTITHMTLQTFPNLWNRLRRKATWNAIVPRPTPFSGEAGVPAEVATNGTWTGVATLTDELKTKRASGKLYIGIQSSHRDRAYYVKIKEPRAKSFENLES